MVPTLRALARSISHAASGAGIRTEVVIVQDRADRETTNALAAALANGALLSASVVRTVIVDHGDLSLARNEGVRASLARYVTVLDADNLPSRAWIAAAYARLEAHDGPAIAHPARIITFGGKHEIWPMVGTDSPEFHAGLLAWYNTWDAFAMASREVFERFPYRPSRPESGFGPEDWAWNCDTVAAQIPHVIVPNTTLLYYAKPHGSLSAAHHASLLPRNELLRSNHIAREELARITGADSSASKPAPQRSALRRATDAVRRRSRTANLAAHAVRRIIDLVRTDEAPPNIDPVIEAVLDDTALRQEWADLHDIQPAIPYPSDAAIGGYSVWGTRWDDEFLPDRSAYWAGVAALPEKIDLLVIAPWVRTGGADLLTRQYIAAARAARPGASIALICSEPEPSTELDALPDDVTVFHLGRYRLWQPFAVRVLGMLITQLRPRTVHVVNSTAGYDAVDVYQRAITAHSRVFLSTFVADRLADGALWSFLHHRSRDFFSGIDAVLTDNRAFADRLVLEQGVPEDVFVVHHQVVDETYVERTAESFTPARPLKLLWVGRFDKQKRIDRLADVLESAALRTLPIEAHIFGEPVIGDVPDLDVQLERLRAAGATIHGPFRGGFQAISPDQFDALIVTSDWEGVPNILLEAMSSGMPVITPAVGGIVELVDDRYGYLVEESAAVASYVDELARVVEDYPRALDRARAARELVEREYSPEGLQNFLESLPGYLSPPGDAPAMSGFHWYADDAARSLLAAGEPLVLLYTGSNGHSNFGDILQTKNIVQYWQRRGDRHPVLFLPRFAAAERGRDAALRRWLCCDHIVYFSPAPWRDSGATNLSPLSPPLSDSMLHVVGGGYLNAMWGASHAEAIDAIASDFSADILTSGLQIDAAAIPLLEQLGSKHTMVGIGLRDHGSLELALEHLTVPVFDTFDDLTEVLREWAGDASARTDGDRRVAIHMNTSDYAGGTDARNRWNEILQLVAATQPDEVILLSSYADARSEVRDTVRTVADLAEHFPFCDVRVLDLAKAALEWRPGSTMPQLLDPLRGVSFGVSSSYHTALLLGMLAVPTYLVGANSYFAQKAELFQLPSFSEFLAEPSKHVLDPSHRIEARAAWVDQLDAMLSTTTSRRSARRGDTPRG